jgi:outer membrane protein OmpA-like peptidoglycan-associated protein
VAQAAAAQDPTDPYAAAKSVIRDTIKWLVAIFGSLAAVVVGGTPFSSFGALPLFGPRFWFAVGGAVVAFGFIIAALYKTLRLLRPDALFPSDLATPAGAVPSTEEDQELQQVRKAIQDRSEAFLPVTHDSIDALLVDRRTALRGMAAAGQDRAVYDRHAQAFANLTPHVEKIRDYASYLRLYNRLIDNVPTLLGLATGALIALLVFAWAANPKKDDAKPPQVLVHGFPVSTPTLLPELAPVLFASGRADLTEEGLAAIAKARDFLWANPQTALLLRAHTDMVASQEINRPLARRRGEAVRQRLLDPGGIAANRVFVAEMPKHALPDLTEDAVASSRNRSVEFVVVNVAAPAAAR